MISLCCRRMYQRKRLVDTFEHERHFNRDVGLDCDFEMDQSIANMYSKLAKACLINWLVLGIKY